MPSFFTKCNITSSPAGSVDVRKPLKVQRTLLLNATEPTLCCMSSFHRWTRWLGSETACAFACCCRKLRPSMTMESNFDRRNLASHRDFTAVDVPEFTFTSTSKVENKAPSLAIARMRYLPGAMKLTFVCEVSGFP